MVYRNGRPNLRALCIEDNLDDLDLMIRALEKEYHVAWQRVETSTSLIKVLEERWDVVLCDYGLPRFSAEEALGIVQSQLGTQGKFVPFIVVSGTVDEDVAIALMKKGARDFISKDKLTRLPFAVQRELRQSGELFGARMRIEESYDGVLEAWGKALELRDQHTQGHTERVTNLALRFALYLNLPHSDFVNINRGSLLHDIGKMGIPDAVLLKPDVLTPDERVIMEMHPRLAYDMLKHIPFLSTAIDIPYSHHERWNGKGYPQKLMSTSIPFVARLFAIVDVYDALTSNRPYRKPWDKAKAIVHLLEERGTLFDPQLVNSFVDMIGRG